MSSPRVVYTPRPDATPANEKAVLARIYELVLRRHSEKVGADLAAEFNGREIQGAPADAESTRRPQSELSR